MENSQHNQRLSRPFCPYVDAVHVCLVQRCSKSRCSWRHPLDILAKQQIPIWCLLSIYAAAPQKIKQQFTTTFPRMLAFLSFWWQCYRFSFCFEKVRHLPGPKQIPNGFSGPKRNVNHKIMVEIRNMYVNINNIGPLKPDSTNVKLTYVVSLYSLVFIQAQNPVFIASKSAQPASDAAKHHCKYEYL